MDTVETGRESSNNASEKKATDHIKKPEDVTRQFWSEITCIDLALTEQIMRQKIKEQKEKRRSKLI